MISGKLSRVTRKRPCVICEHVDWCGYSHEIAVCMRISQGSVAEASNGGWIHRVEGQPIAEVQPSPKVSFTGKCEKLRAPVERCHLVYTALLESLSLSRRHTNNLLNRGICDVEQGRELYATAPGTAEAATLLETLVLQFDLTGVPGVYREGLSWRLISLPAGFLIPSRDPRGRIQALRLRLDEPRASQKYLWVSSPNKPAGASSGAPPHFARPWRVTSTGELIITEGELKAQVAAQFLDCTVIGLPGVTSFKDTIGVELRQIFPNLERVRIAFDCDAATNPTVRHAQLRLARALSSAGLTVSKMVWPESVQGNRVKGIDDFVIYAYAK